LNLVLRELDKSWKNWGKIGFCTQRLIRRFFSILSGLTGAQPSAVLSVRQWGLTDELSLFFNSLTGE
jgi:hypothetical protein